MAEKRLAAVTAVEDGLRGEEVMAYVVPGHGVSQEDVHECAVLAHELPGRRMTLRAVVRLGDCVEESDATRTLLQQFLRDRLLPFKYPRIVEFVADLAKTGTGKIDRQALRRSECELKR